MNEYSRDKMKQVSSQNEQEIGSITTYSISRFSAITSEKKYGDPRHANKYGKH